jgi:uridine monophosphate synthetase
VGLDPHRRLLAEPGAEAAAALCRRIIEETAGAAAAFKVNTAFFEVYGPAGWEALQDVVRSVPDDIPVIVDAKRGDIGSTAEAYAEAIFDGLGADAVTVNPYLGADAVAPFLRDDGYVFVLVRTSNPGSADLQELLLADGGRVFERVPRLLSGPGVGYVVGATFPEAVTRVRRLAPNAWILAPGVGAQGGDIDAAVAAGRRADGMGILLPVSRAIAEADDRGVAASLLRLAANAAPPAATTDAADDLAAALFTAGCIRFGSFTLKSGVVSPIYIDLRRLAGFPAVLEEVAAALADLLAPLRYDHIAALPYAALPIGTALALRTRRSLIYPRRQPKQYGTKATVEGVFAAGDTAVIVDDLATDGATKIEAAEQLGAVGVTVTDVAVLIDRGARASIEGAGLAYHAVFTLRDLVDRLLRLGLVSGPEHGAVVEFLT